MLKVRAIMLYKAMTAAMTLNLSYCLGRSWVSLASSNCIPSPDLCKHVCLINPCVVQDLSGVVSKASLLHGMEALPSLAGLKLKPEQGRAQTNGAVSDDPSSPLIAAKNPFHQVGCEVLGCT